MNGSACVVVPVAATVAGLVDGQPVSSVFSPRERRLGGGPPSRAGRVAAKLAVRRLLRPATVTSLSAIEILPARSGLCDPARPCHRSHRPVVVLGPALAAHLGPAAWVDISISHSASTAMCLAVLRPGPPPAGGRRAA